MKVAKTMDASFADPRNLAALCGILDDRARPHYELSNSSLKERSIMKALQNPEHMRYYRMLEDDLELTFRYVDPHQLEVYSDEFARIILMAATEIENVLREFAFWAQARRGHPRVHPQANILKLIAVVETIFPNFASMQLLAPSISLSIHPWKGASATSAPDWWTNGYNKIKHDRLKHLDAPTLRRALYAVGALQVVLLHFYRLHHGPTAMLADNAIPRLLIQWDPASPPSSTAWMLVGLDLPDDPKTP